mgnify:CR=1 FL=1
MSEQYEFIDGEKCASPIVRMCDWLEVSRSGYYEWRDRPASATAERRAALEVDIKRIFDEFEQTYGYRRIHAELGREGIEAGPELVRALMRKLGLVPCQQRIRRHHLTRPGAARGVADLVGGDFTADAPGRKLVGDITYLPTWQGWVYLATVLDCHTKEVVGWAMDDHYRTPLISAAIDMAVRNGNVETNAIFHTDRGSNFLSDEFATKLGSLNIRHSVGRTGVCWDNAMAESFFGVLKVERVHRTQYPTRNHAKKDVARYIELFYNTRRIHSALGYRTPAEVRAAYNSSQQAA